ncbi:response regulator transcription factor [Desulfogranum mediterraneum]|uniref:response regulator transcription factor n=1 Tax=Desulfogranum mediterraneum TaxID=160661 RepID=UPI00041E12E0|nr:response regulator [Desulfogranum mediterraneum]
MAKNTILVVDDSPTQLNMMKAPFEKNGYQVITATDGEEALSMVHSEKPMLVVLDVIMPKMNGFQVCRKIKTEETTRDIKVVMLTSKNQKSDAFWGKKQGADKYMTKPFDEQELYDAAMALL